MRNIVFIMMIFSLGVSWGADDAKHGTDPSKSDAARAEGEGLPKAVSDALTKLESPDDPEETLKSLDSEDLNKIIDALEKQIKDGGNDDQMKRAREDWLATAQRIKEEKTSDVKVSTAAPKPLEKANSNVRAKDGKKIPIFKLPGGFEAYADPEGRKTKDDQPLIVVGKEGATVMDGVFPASAFGLSVDAKTNTLSINPTPQTLTVSTGNGLKVNRTVPVIFNAKGEAFAREGVIDQKGNQTLYWNENDETRSSSWKGNEVKTGVKRPSLSAQTPTVSTRKYYLGNDNRDFDPPPTPEQPAPITLDSIMAAYTATRQEPTPPAPTTPVSGPERLTNQVPSGGCADGSCGANRKPQVRKICGPGGCRPIPAR